MKCNRLFSAVLAVSCVASLAACGTGNGSANSNKTADGKTIIRIQTYNGVGYGKPSQGKVGVDFWSKYEKLHPNIKIEETNAGQSGDARSAFNTSITSGTSTYDIFVAETDWMPSVKAIADKFVDLTPYTKDNDWLDWKAEEGTDSGGRLIAAGTDIGPAGICYRHDLLEQAGFPADRDSVAEWLGGENATWDSYFEAGREYTEKTGKPWFDSMVGLEMAMVTQIEESFVKKDGTIIADTNKDVKSMYDMLLDNTDLSAHLDEWTDDWNAAFKSDDGFATIMCPAWLVNNIKGNVGEDFKGWDLADVFPGGGDNRGGSFLIVPESSPVKEEAAKLVAWLTAPEQQITSFTVTSNYPSSKAAQASEEVQSKTDPVLNDAPTGKIYSNRAKAVTVVPYRGDQYFDLNTKFQDALKRVDVTKEQSASESWQQFLSDVKSMG